MSACATSSRRAGMTDDEHDQDVEESLRARPGVETDPDWWYDDADLDDGETCKVCGATGGCAYDAEGRVLIHTGADQ